MPLPALPPTFSAPPILMYHRVDPERPADAVGRDLTVTPARFEAQLRALERGGIRAISVHDFIVRLRDGAPLGKIAVLTFDDGYGDQYTYAAPLLRKYHANASFYIVTGNVGTPRHLTWRQIAAMRRSGFDIAAQAWPSHSRPTRLSSSHRKPGSRYGACASMAIGMPPRFGKLSKQRKISRIL